MAQAVLTEQDHAILKFEERHAKHSVMKVEAILETFEFSAARYYQLLLTIIKKPSAVAEYPQLVHRLQRTSDARSSARASRAFVSAPRR